MSEKSYKNLLKKMSGLDLAIPGTIREVYLKCGKENCSCISGKKNDKHGPYYFWDRLSEGKLTSSSIPKNQVAQFKKWIKNRHKLEKMQKQLLDQGQNVARAHLKK